MTGDPAGQADRLAAHHARFAALPLISVPSAAITDQQVQAWSREAYDKDVGARSTTWTWGRHDRG